MVWKVCYKRQAELVYLVEDAAAAVAASVKTFQSCLQSLLTTMGRGGVFINRPTYTQLFLKSLSNGLISN